MIGMALMWDKLDKFLEHTQQIAISVQAMEARLCEISKSVRDIRDVYGKLLQLQTGGVPPWYFREKGYNVVDRPPETEQTPAEIKLPPQP